MSHQHNFEVIVDHKKHHWHHETITGSQVKELAGVSENFGVWEDVPGKEDKPIEDNQIVQLHHHHKTHFFTGEPHTTAGNSVVVLPQSSAAYLTEKNVSFDQIIADNQQAIILRAYELPTGIYDHDKADILVLLPNGFPDVPTDMFYLFPWVKLNQGNRFPEKADQPFDFQGQRWQRWSRHNNQWRAGIDDIRLVMRRIDEALRSAR